MLLTFSRAACPVLPSFIVVKDCEKFKYIRVSRILGSEIILNNPDIKFSKI